MVSKNIFNHCGSKILVKDQRYNSKVKNIYIIYTKTFARRDLAKLSLKFKIKSEKLHRKGV
jgi:hypothetical protein